MSTKWNARVDVSDVFHNDAMTLPEKAKVIASRFRNKFGAHPEGEWLWPLLDELEDQDDADSFDIVWDEIYDWCDTDKRCWVVTR